MTIMYFKIGRNKERRQFLALNAFRTDSAKLLQKLLVNIYSYAISTKK